MTHYREGAFLSGPFKVPNAPSVYDAEHTVTLEWRAPERALYFDILRASNPDAIKLGKECTDCAVETNLVVSTFKDEKQDNELQGFTVPKNLEVFSRITKPAGNLRAFHKAKLDCIGKEAGGPYDCEQPKLDKIPVEGRQAP